MKQVLTQKWIYGFTAFTVLMVGIFGVNVCIGMNMHSLVQSEHTHAAMDCQNSSLADSCSMDVTDHVNQWQNQTASFLLGFDILEIIVGLALSIAAFFLHHLLRQLFNSTSKTLQRFLFYFRAHPEWSLYQPLHWAFAKGLIHPKIFVA